MATLYDELGVNARATTEEIVAAYRELARKYHPDRNAGFERLAKERFQRIQHAFESLSNPDKRAKYDESLRPHSDASPVISTPASSSETTGTEIPNRAFPKRHSSMAVFCIAAFIAAGCIFGLIYYLPAAKTSPGSTPSRPSSQARIAKNVPKRSIEQLPSRPQRTTEQPKERTTSTQSQGLVEDREVNVTAPPPISQPRTIDQESRTRNEDPERIAENDPVASVDKSKPNVVDELLLSLSKYESDSTQSGGNDRILAWYQYRQGPTPAVIAAVQVRHELIRSLSNYYDKDVRIQKLFDDWIQRLKSAPNPSDRAIAALWLSRSDGISAATVPALLDAVKNDASMDVKRAVFLSLAGFSEHTGPIAAVLDSGVEHFSGDEPTQFVLFGTLSIDSDSRQFKRMVIGQLSSYKTSRNKKVPSIIPLCQVIRQMKSPPAWVVPPLVAAAEVAMKREGDAFREVSETIREVGVGDTRAIRFYERTAKEGPEGLRVFCDSIAKELKRNATE